MMQKVAKNRHLGTIALLRRAICSQLRRVSTIGKNLLSSNISSRCPHNMANFVPLAPEIGPVVWGTALQPNFAALNRGRHLYLAGWPSCWALAHILVLTSVTFWLPVTSILAVLYYVCMFHPVSGGFRA